MAFYECKVGGSGGGIPPQLQTDMDSVFNKKLGTSTTYPSTSWAKEVNLMGLLPEKTVSGAVASFPDGADDVPLKSATFDIAPTLDGVSAVNVVRTGKNIADFSDVTISSASYVLNNLDVFCPTGKVTLSFDFTGTGSSTSLRFDDKGGNSVGVTAKNITEGRNEIVVTLSANAYKIKFYSNAIGAFSDFQLEIGNGATSYEEYTATTRTISLGQTVYGGSVTVDEDGECELTENRSVLVFDGSDEQVWTVHASGTDTTVFKHISGVTIANETNEQVSPNTITYSSAANTADSSRANTIRWATSGNVFIQVANTTATTATELKNWLALNNVKITANAATPTESDLDPITPITSALGVNNIWCDTGDVETLTYRTPEVIPIPCLSSGGNQAITLPIYDDGGYTFKFKLMVFAPQNNTLILGGYWDAGCLLFHTYKVGDNYVLYYYPSNTPVSAPIKFGKWMDIELAPSYMKVDGVTYQGTAASRYHNATRLFAYDNAYGSSIALSEIEVYNSSNVKVLDLVPTKNSSGQGIFHDTVNNTNYSSTQQPCGYIEL